MTLVNLLERQISGSAPNLLNWTFTKPTGFELCCSDGQLCDACNFLCLWYEDHITWFSYIMGLDIKIICFLLYWTYLKLYLFFMSHVRVCRKCPWIFKKGLDNPDSKGKFSVFRIAAGTYTQLCPLQMVVNVFFTLKEEWLWRQGTAHDLECLLSIISHRRQFKKVRRLILKHRSAWGLLVLLLLTFEDRLILWFELLSPLEDNRGWVSAHSLPLSLTKTKLLWQKHLQRSCNSPYKEKWSLVETARLKVWNIATF